MIVLDLQLDRRQDFRLNLQIFHWKMDPWLNRLLKSTALNRLIHGNSKFIPVLVNL